MRLFECQIYHIKRHLIKIKESIFNIQSYRCWRSRDNNYHFDYDNIVTSCDNIILFKFCTVPWSFIHLFSFFLSFLSFFLYFYFILFFLILTKKIHNTQTSNLYLIWNYFAICFNIVSTFMILKWGILCLSNIKELTAFRQAWNTMSQRNSRLYHVKTYPVLYKAGKLLHQISQPSIIVTARYSNNKDILVHATETLELSHLFEWVFVFCFVFFFSIMLNRVGEELILSHG